MKSNLLSNENLVNELGPTLNQMNRHRGYLWLEDSNIRVLVKRDARLSQSMKINV